MIKNFSVPDPCHEPWDGMKPQENGRYCDSCKKVVIDFTNKSNEEIIEYLNLHAGKKMCGTFRKTQLLESEKRYNEYVLKFLASLLLAFGMTLFSCTPESIDLGDQPNDQIKVEDPCTTLTGIMITPPQSEDSLHTSITEEKIESIAIHTETTTGDIAIPDISPPLIQPIDTIQKLQDSTEELIVGVITDEMPEFSNAGQTLSEYISQHLKYPSEIDAQGTVYVGFIVMKDGSITDVKILRGITPSLDKEAMNVIRSMPKWKPGKNNGQPVNVRYTLPIRFRLK